MHVPSQQPRLSPSHVPIFGLVGSISQQGSPLLPHSGSGSGTGSGTGSGCGSGTGSGSGSGSGTGSGSGSGTGTGSGSGAVQVEPVRTRPSLQGLVPASLQPGWPTSPQDTHVLRMHASEWRSQASPGQHASLAPPQAGGGGGGGGGGGAGGGGLTQKAPSSTRLGSHGAPAAQHTAHAPGSTAGMAQISLTQGGREPECALPKQQYPDDVIQTAHPG